MSDTTATMLQDKLNSIERNAYDGIDFSQEVTAAYVLADELGERIDQLKDENAKLRDERDRMYKANVEKNGEILRLLDENARLKQELEAVGAAAYLYGRTDLADKNKRLRELATHALRHIIEFECEADNGDQFQGKPCEWCDYHGTSDCPKIIAVMYGELGIEVDG